MQRKPTTTYHTASPKTWELIRAAYLAGLSAPALAARFGVSVGAVRKRAGRRLDQAGLRSAAGSQGALFRA